MIPVRSVLAALVSLAACSTVTVAEIDMKGFVDTYQSIGLETPHRYMGSRTRLRLEGNLTHGDAWAVASVNAVYNGIVQEETGLHLREAYVAWAGDRFDFRAGNQIIIWGQSEGLYVTDNVSPKDYSEALARDFDDMRIPVTALRGRMMPGMVTIELVCLPLFTPAIIPYKREDAGSDNPWAIALPAGVPVNESETPDLLLRNAEVGAKVSLSASALDIALSGLYTWNDVPVMHFGADGITPRHHRLSVWGVDASVPAGMFVLRGEAALRQGDRFTLGSGAVREKKSAVGLFGIDAGPGREWDISGQVYDRYIIRYDDRCTEPKHDAYATLRVSKNLLRSTLAVSVMAFYGFEHEEAYCRLSASYALTDAAAIAAGFDLFDGSEGSFGMYADNSAAFIECKYNF